MGTFRPSAGTPIRGALFAKFLQRGEESVVQARKSLEKIKVYVPGKPIEEVQRELGLTRVAKLASNENPVGPSPKAIAAMVDQAGKTNLYPDGNGYYLKEALAKHWQVSIEQIALGNGSDELIQLLALAYVEAGDEVIMAKPSFPRYEPVVRMMEGVPVEIPLTADWRHDLPAMAQAITEKTRMIFLCNPNNPTGTMVTREEVAAFMARVPAGVLVVFDEAYYEYVNNEEYPDGLDYLRQGRDVIVLRTFSKIYGLAGLRVGYALTKPEIVQNLERVRPPFNVNALAQAAARAALADQVHLERVRELNAQGLQFFYTALEKLGLEYVPSYTNFVLINVERPAAEVFQQLLRKGYIVRDVGLGTWLRVTVGLPEENQGFIQALREVINS